MIPKRIFFYWSGHNLSWMRYMTLYSFRKMNPSWDVTLYISDNTVNIKTWNGVEEQDFSNYIGINYFDKLSELNIKIEKVEFPVEYKEKLKNLSPVHESDLFRYYQLYKNGGFYCDMDVIFFRPIEKFYNQVMNTDTIVYHCPTHLAIGFLGSSVDNQFYKDLFNFAIQNLNTIDYQSVGVDIFYKMIGGSRSNNVNFMDNLHSKYPELNINNIETSLIYFFDWTKIEYNFTNPIYINKFDKESIGYHWFGGSKISQNYNNILNESNYKEYKTTFSVLAKTLFKD